jgi:hypothetical protein
MSHELSERVETLQAAAKEAKYPAFRRRRFLVDSRYQLKAGLLTGLAVMLLLVFINLIWYAITLKTVAGVFAEAPELARQLAVEHRVFYYVILAVTCVTLVGVVVVTILETHRTAGAAYALEQRLRDVEDGRYSTRVSLRKGDNLKPLGAVLDRTIRSLQQRTLREAETLEKLAREVEEAGVHEVAAGLARMAEEKRQLAG